MTTQSCSTPQTARTVFLSIAMPLYGYLLALLVKVHNSCNVFSRCSEKFCLIRQIEQYGLFPQYWCSYKLYSEACAQSMNRSPITIQLLLATFFCYSVTIIWFRSSTNSSSTLLLPKFADRAFCGKFAGSLSRRADGSSGSCSVLTA